MSAKNAMAGATLAEVAQALGVSKQAIAKRAEKESWPFAKVSVRGGQQRLYALETLPEAVAKAVLRLREIVEEEVNPPAHRQVMRALTATLNQLQAEEEAARAAKVAAAEAQLQMLTGLSEREALSLKAHCEIADGWKVWFVRAQPLKKSHSWAPYAAAYNGAEVPVSKAVREAYPKVSPRSVQRWVTDYERGNFAALVDRRNNAEKKENSIFRLSPLLAAYAKKILMERPGIKTQQLLKLLTTAATDEKSGEALFPAPSYHQVFRFQRAWIEENRDLYLQQTNPDAFKNRAMLAFGSYSEDVSELNQRWEMDATPADWLLLDADGQKRRYTVSVIVDIWSRRMLVLVSRTPKTETHCLALRAALLAWGVPKEIVTDNGADYQSDHFRRVLQALAIEHITRNPFSPEEKPHVERGIGTLNHSILELLPNFAGHNVADRKAIEARRSFAERLAKRGEIVDFAEVADGSCSGEALQAHINTWLAGSYEHNEHGGLKTTPFLKAASWRGEVRRIEDERSLDILLARPAGGGQRTLQKKGIKIDGAWYIAPELASIEMGSVLDIYETPDLGRVVVYYRKNFLCIAEDPARTGVDRREIARTADRMQKERLAAARRKLKEETRGLPDTDAVMQRHLAERAEAAGKLVQAPFGKVAKTHSSNGLEEAAKAKAALAGPQPSSRSAELQALAEQAMAEAPANVTTLPSAMGHATPLEGMTTAERYTLWQTYEALVAAHGGDIDVLEEAWQRRFFVGFPQSSIFRAEAALAAAQKEAAAR